MTSSLPCSSSSEPPAKDTLLSRLATDVRHTLHHLLGSIELISEEPLSGLQRAHLVRCRESGHELLRVVNDVAELAEPNAAAQPPSTFEPVKMLEEFSHLVGLRAARKGLDLNWTVDRRVPRLVIGNRAAVENVLYRIVDNSLKFTGRGGIRISVQSEAHAAESVHIIIEVSDTGPGMPPHVLDDFQRPLSESRTSGLGLALARKIVAGIGGELNVVSSGPQGTAFRMKLPVEVAAGSHVEPGFEERAPGRKLRLLVAEDSDDSFAVFETFIRDEGHDLSRAVNGADAVEMFKAGAFDLVVMDANMPVMDGYSATRSIRDWETQQTRARCPILLLSADPASKQARLGSAVGCSGYLTKPVPKRELLFALTHYASPPGACRLSGDTQR